MPSTPVNPMEPTPPVDFLGGFLSYLIPGLGQMTQGRFGKGLLFMVCLLGMFHLGQAMGNWQNVYLPKFGEDPVQRHPVELNLMGSIYNRWHFGGQVWIGIAAWPALWQFYNMKVPNAEANPFFHNYQKAPIEDDVNAFLRDSEKSADLGWVFTVIAGMLNILVIYDAFAGPAFPRRPTDTKTDHKTAAQAGVEQEAALP